MKGYRGKTVPPPKRLTVSEHIAKAARLRQETYEYALAEGIARGKQAAEDAARNSIKLKMAEQKIKLAQSLGQMVEVAARAVITFVGEGGFNHG